MNHEKLIEQLRNAAWESDCFEMILTQNGGADPGAFIGPGYLRQDDDGNVHYRLYPLSWKNVEPDFFAIQVAEAGKLVAPETCFGLKTRSMDGMNWEIESTIPQVDGSWNEFSDAFEPIVGGPAFEIRSSRKLDVPVKGYLIKIYYFCNVQLPGNNHTTTIKETARGSKIRSHSRDSVHYDTPFGTFRATNESGQLSVSMRSDMPFPSHFDSRITEALGLVLAKPLLWNVIVEFADGVETVRVRARKRIIHSNFKRPVGGSLDWDFTGDIWRLFSLYLCLVSTYDKPEFHPVSRHLFAVLEASAGGLTSEALTLGVAAEGIVKYLFPDAASSILGMADVVPQLQAYLAAWPKIPGGELGRSLTKRLPGMVAQLKNVSTKDKLYALANAWVIDKDQVKAWNDLRNTAAHGATFDSRSNQKLVDLCNQVTVLIYYLIFKGAGYEGPFQDYSTYGFPTKYYRGRPPTHGEIANAAKLLCDKETQTRGYAEHGHDVKHWLEAEKRLNSRLM